MKKALKVLGIIVIALVLVAVVYVAYMWFGYSRIEDNVVLTVDEGANNECVKTGEEYTIMTHNIGFGAYTQDFTFFMDGGKESRARSKESVINCVNKAADTMLSYDTDFAFIQEVDFDSTRSRHVDEREILDNRFENYSNVEAINYHSNFIMYPIFKPHGIANSCISTYSKFDITSALRRKLPISESFSKLIDLDRCYSVSRIPVENGRELVLFNVHLSAYGGNDEVRSGQMSMLFDDMKKEHEAGNYCICGGDFNHDFVGDSVEVLNENAERSGWTMKFPQELVPEGFTIQKDYSVGEELPTCRDCDIPYQEGSFVVIVDGFLTSDNVEMTYLENVQEDFEYSDHNPVLMRFKLK